MTDGVWDKEPGAGPGSPGSFQQGARLASLLPFSSPRDSLQALDAPAPEGGVGGWVVWAERSEGGLLACLRPLLSASFGLPFRTSTRASYSTL